MEDAGKIRLTGEPCVNLKIYIAKICRDSNESNVYIYMFTLEENLHLNNVNVAIIAP